MQQQQIEIPSESKQQPVIGNTIARTKPIFVNPFTIESKFKLVEFN
jgi:hypothetical protein